MDDKTEKATSAQKPRTYCKECGATILFWRDPRSQLPVYQTISKDYCDPCWEEKVRQADERACQFVLPEPPTNSRGDPWASEPLLRTYYAEDGSVLYQEPG